MLLLGRLAGLDAARQITSDIGELAEVHGLLLGLASERVGLVNAGKTVAGHLGIAEGRRVMKIGRMVATAEGVPLEWRMAIVILDP